MTWVIYDFFRLAASSFELYYYSNYTFTHFPGITITSDEMEETLTKDFEMLKRTLPDDAFLNTIDGQLILWQIFVINFERVSTRYGRKQPSYSVIFSFYNKYEKEHGISKDDKLLELCFMQMILSHMKKHTKI